jgi:hypothetical protein
MMVIFFIASLIPSALCQSNLIRRDVDPYANYPQCSHDLCIVPVSVTNACDQPGVGNACGCETVGYISSRASCVGSLCPNDAAEVFTTLQANCLNYGGYSIPVDLDAWVTDSRTQWTSGVVGIFTTAPPTPTPIIATPNFANYPDCARKLCIVPSLYYLIENRTNAYTCSSISYMAVFAACVGKLCPADVAGTYTVWQNACLDSGGLEMEMSLEQWDAASHWDPVSAYMSLVNEKTGMLPLPRQVF